LTERRRSIVTSAVKRRLGLAALAAAVVLVSSAEATASTEATGHLFAKVTRAGQVSLRDAAGRRVRTLAAGSYVVTVRDRSKRQNFHLVGQKQSVGERTGIRFVGTVRWTLVFSAGAYRYYSDGRPDTLTLFRAEG
jgi:hypothetical protein